MRLFADAEEAFQELSELRHRYTGIQFQNDYITRGFAFPLFRKADILITGLNPSHSNDEHDTFNPHHLADQTHPYFKKIIPFGNRCAQENWTYADLFYLKETNSNKVFENWHHKEYFNFLVSQLQITQRIIESINPKVIVVLNASSQNFFGLNRAGDLNVWMGYQEDPALREVYGTPVITSVKSGILKHEPGFDPKEIFRPIFFSSYIGNLSNSDKERLAWHVRHVMGLLKQREPGEEPS